MTDLSCHKQTVFEILFMCEYERSLQICKSGIRKVDSVSDITECPFNYVICQIIIVQENHFTSARHDTNRVWRGIMVWGDHLKLSIIIWFKPWPRYYAVVFRLSFGITVGLLFITSLAQIAPINCHWSLVARNSCSLFLCIRCKHHCRRDHGDDMHTYSCCTESCSHNRWNSVVQMVLEIYQSA